MVASHAGQRTTVIVAHRLSTVQKCNIIVVLSKGIVAESGTHDALLQKKQVAAFQTFLLDFMWISRFLVVLEAGSRPRHKRLNPATPLVHTQDMRRNAFSPHLYIRAQMQPINYFTLFSSCQLDTAHERTHCLFAASAACHGCSST